MGATASAPQDVRDPLTRPARLEPRDGDVVVTCDSRSGLCYTIRQLPGDATQLSASSQDEAVRVVRGFAETHAVDIWYVADGTCRLLEAFRPRAWS